MDTKKKLNKRHLRAKKTNNKLNKKRVFFYQCIICSFLLFVVFVLTTKGMYVANNFKDIISTNLLIVENRYFLNIKAVFSGYNIKYENHYGNSQANNYTFRIDEDILYNINTSNKLRGITYYNEKKYIVP